MVGTFQAGLGYVIGGWFFYFPAWLSGEPTTSHGEF